MGDFKYCQELLVKPHTRIKRTETQIPSTQAQIKLTIKKKSPSRARTCYNEESNQLSFKHINKPKTTLQQAKDSINKDQTTSVNTEIQKQKLVSGQSYQLAKKNNEILTNLNVVSPKAHTSMQ
jgi:thiol:disulfide interchange protein